MTAVVAAVVLLAFMLGFRYYARFIGERIYQDREEIVTPAHEFEDGRDFVPTNKHVLFGHHFTSIAGAAPILHRLVEGLEGAQGFEILRVRFEGSGKGPARPRRFVQLMPGHFAKTAPQGRAHGGGGIRSQLKLSLDRSRHFLGAAQLLRAGS
jgi:hypothetical protein